MTLVTPHPTAEPVAPDEQSLTSAAALKSRRRFRAPKLVIESALIVLSVLLGFAANEWHDRRAEHALAAQALVNFRREIASNLATLDSVYPQHVAIVKRLGTAAETTRPGETAFQALVGVLPADFRSIPPLADAAWETAVSTGALRFLGYERAARLSETYQIQRTTFLQTLLRLENRLNTPESFEPARRKAMLLVYRLLFQEVSGQESYLIDVYRKTLRQLGDSTR